MGRRSIPVILFALPFIALTAASATESDSRCGQPVSGTLTLQAAFDRLDLCHPAVLQARAAVGAAEADVVTADHWQNPVLGAGISNINPHAGLGGGPLADRTVDSYLRIDQLFERGGKRGARRDAARANEAASHESLRDAGLRAQQDLLEAYLNAAAATQAFELLTDAAASYRQSAAAMERRFTAGDVARVEVDRTIVDAGRADADAAAAATASADARADLAVALGTARLDARLLSLDEIAARRRAQAPDVEIEALIARRADVAAASSRLQAARAALAGARAGRKSDVDVTLGFDHWPVSATNPQGTGDSFTVGFSVPLHLFDSGEGPVGHAVADVSAAEAELRRAQAAASVEIRTAREELARATTLAERYRSTLLPEAEAVLRAEETAFQRGGVSLIELLDARRDARQVAVAAILARRDAEIAAGRLALASGRGPLAQYLGSTP